MASSQAQLIALHRIPQYELTTTKLGTTPHKLPQINLYLSGKYTVSQWLLSDNDPAEAERVRLVSCPNPIEARVLGVSLDELSSLDWIRNAIEGTLRRDFPAILLDEEGRDDALVEYVWEKAIENVREINISNNPHTELSLYFLVDVDIHRLYAYQTDDDDEDDDDDNDDGCDGMVPALESEVEALERVSSGKMGCCAICLEEECSRDCEVVSMPCRHVFHGSCIRKWLQINHCCPMCRFQMTRAT